MLLATTQVEDFDRFLEVFSTKGAEKRKQHGSKGALVFRDPSEDDRVWVVFDWDEQGWQSFVSDPEVPPIMKEAGHKAKPQAAQFAGRVRRLTAGSEGGAVGPWRRPIGSASRCRCAGRQSAAGGSCRRITLLRLRRLRLRTCPPPPARASSLPRPGTRARGAVRKRLQPSRPQLLRRAHTPMLSAGASRDRDLPPRLASQRCAAVPSEGQRRPGRGAPLLPSRGRDSASRAERRGQALVGSSRPWRSPACTRSSSATTPPPTGHSCQTSWGSRRSMPARAG